MKNNYLAVIQSISNKILSKLASETNALGIFLIGSSAQGNFDEFSDIDFYIITKRRQKEDRTQFEHEERQVELLFNTPAEIQSYILSEKGIYKNVSHMLANGKILLQKNKEVKKLQQLARLNMRKKVIVTVEEVTMHKYSLRDFLGDMKRDVKNADQIAFQIDSTYFIQNAIELILKQKKISIRKSREMAEVFTKVNPGFVSLMKKFYEAKNMGTKFQNLEKIARLLLK